MAGHRAVMMRLSRPQRLGRESLARFPRGSCSGVRLAGPVGGGWAGGTVTMGPPSEHCGLSWCPSWMTCRLGCPHFINPFSFPGSKQFVSVSIVQRVGPSPARCGRGGRTGKPPGAGRAWGTCGDGWGRGPGLDDSEEEGLGLRDA